MNYQKILSEGESNELTHKKFVRFGLGEYPRETFYFVKQGKAVQIQAGFEYLDDIFLTIIELAEKNGNMDLEIELTGLIVSKKDIGKKIEEFGIEPVKATKSKCTIKEAMTIKKFKEFMKEFGKFYLALGLKSDLYNVKVKGGLPKPGGLKEKYLTAKFPLNDYDSLFKEFLYDIETKNIKKAEIKYTYNIESINVPKEYEDDFLLARLNAKRKGTIKREIKTDGEDKITTINFEA